MEGREELEREAEREPLREVVSGTGEAPAPAEDGEEIEERLERESRREPRRLAAPGRRGQRRERPGMRVEDEARGDDDDGRRRERVADCAVAGAAPSADERSCRDDSLSEDP